MFGSSGSAPARTRGSEVTHLGATDLGSEVVTHVQSGSIRGWYLGATDLGSKLGATDLGAELGAKICGSEL